MTTLLLGLAALLMSAASFSRTGWSAVCILVLLLSPLIALSAMLFPVLALQTIVFAVDRARQEKRSVLQFSLKKLLAAVLVTGLAFGAAGIRLRAFSAVAALDGDWDGHKVFLSGTDATDSDLRHVPWMGRVEVVWLCNTNVGDEGLQHLQGITELRAIFADNTRISDAGVSRLEPLPLRWLGLNGTTISDASIPYLAKLTMLEHLDVKQTRLSEAGLSRLARALPRCQISR